MTERPAKPPFDCPTCGKDLQLTATNDGELVNFLCGTCGTCWHPELGWLRRVDPYRCPGCELSGICRLAVDRLTGSGAELAADRAGNIHNR